MPGEGSEKRDLVLGGSLEELGAGDFIYRDVLAARMVISMHPR